MGSYASHSARDMLHAVNQSTVALLDRWNVSIAPKVRRLLLVGDSCWVRLSPRCVEMHRLVAMRAWYRHRCNQSHLPRRREDSAPFVLFVVTGRPSADQALHPDRMIAKQQEPPKQLRRVAALAGAATADEPSVKAMNNYLGIGIDAKVTASVS